jgi:hypothetical protein
MTHGESLSANHGSVHLYEAGLSSAIPLHEIANITSADDRTRMRGHAGWIYLAAGMTNAANAKVTVLSAPAGDGIYDRLQANAHVFNSGDAASPKGLPDIYVDATGAVQLTYGSAESVYYNRLSAEGKVILPEDALLPGALGTYLARVGMSTVAASDDSRIVMAVVLSPPGTNAATDSTMLWTYSVDGGQTWSEAEALAGVDPILRTSGGVA